jgi:3-dehydro-L-gulonate 2-dehydrogenase
MKHGSIQDPNADPELVSAFGAIERYDGRYSLGALNAEWSMNRAIDLADKNGIGCVALRNTNHWGRAGSYGWLAAEAGCLAICWTNTVENQPAWGSTTNAIGNNPLVLAAPGVDGKHLVLDMAMSQFSMGRLSTHKITGEELPVIGGVDKDHQPTTDAAAILDGGHSWPMGFWKGSGLAILLDALAAILADGNDTQDITAKKQGDHGPSQVYLAFRPDKLGGRDAAQGTAKLIEHLAKINPNSRYPGQAALDHRQRSLTEGIWVSDPVWQSLTDALARPTV